MRERRTRPGAGCHSRAVRGCRPATATRRSRPRPASGCGRFCSRPGEEAAASAMISAAPDEAGQLGLRAGLLGHRGPRAAGADREALEQARPRGSPRRCRSSPGCRGPPGRCARRTPTRWRWCRSATPRAIPSAPRPAAAQVGRARPCGMVSGGKPCGSVPDQLDAVRGQVEDARGGDRQHHRHQHARGPWAATAAGPGSATRPARPTASGGRPTVSPSATPSTNPLSSAIRPSASTEKPNSFGSWPTRIVRASPFM